MIRIPIENKFAVRWGVDSTTVHLNGLLQLPGEDYNLHEGRWMEFDPVLPAGSTIVIHDLETFERHIHQTDGYSAWFGVK